MKEVGGVVYPPGWDGDLHDQPSPQHHVVVVPSIRSKPKPAAVVASPPAPTPAAAATPAAKPSAPAATEAVAREEEEEEDGPIAELDADDDNSGEGGEKKGAGGKYHKKGIHREARKGSVYAGFGEDPPAPPAPKFEFVAKASLRSGNVPGKGGKGGKGKGIASRGARKGSVYEGFGEDDPAAGSDSDEFESDGSGDYDQASSKPAWKLAAVAKEERERMAKELAADPAYQAQKAREADPEYLAQKAREAAAAAQAVVDASEAVFKRSETARVARAAAKAKAAKIAAAAGDGAGDESDDGDLEGFDSDGSGDYDMASSKPAWKLAR
jgi:hypothetical protein